MSDEGRTRDELIEQAAGAWRPSDLDGGPREHPAWADLDPSGREEAFEASVVWRRIESALDPRGFSTTARAVLDRIRAKPGS